MVNVPAQGLNPWYDEIVATFTELENDRIEGDSANALVAEAIDTRLEAVESFFDESVIDSKIETDVAAAVAGHTPGSEMAYAESTTGGSTTVVTPSVAIISALTLTVTGEGRPVDIELYIPRLYHSVADAQVFGVIASQIVGSGITVYEQVVGHSSPHTDRSTPFYCKRRKALTDGVDYTIGFYVCSAGTAGTTTYGAAGGLQRMWSAVTSR